jgi:hypothetical protein
VTITPGLPFSIGDKVYAAHTATAGTVTAITLEGSRTNPTIRYSVRWADDDMSMMSHYACEMSTDAHVSG